MRVGVGNETIHTWTHTHSHPPIRKHSWQSKLKGRCGEKISHANVIIL